MSGRQLRTILYAEDEADIRDIAQIALEELGGFNIIYCKNGVEVLDKIKTSEPNLIILDVMMPEMDGPTALLNLRKMPKYESIPVIFMTAKINIDEINKYKEMGAINVIAKPFDPMQLADTIGTIWERYIESCLIK